MGSTVRLWFYLEGRVNRILVYTTYWLFDSPEKVELKREEE